MKALKNERKIEKPQSRRNPQNLESCRNLENLPSFSETAAERKVAVEGWLLKPDGLYDTWEPGVDDDWFEEGDWEWRLRGSHRGWSFRPVRY